MPPNPAKKYHGRAPNGKLQDAIEDATKHAVHDAGPGKWWLVEQISFRGDNPRVGDYLVVVSETPAPG